MSNKREKLCKGFIAKTAVDRMREVVSMAKKNQFSSGCEFRRCMDSALARIESECMAYPLDADGVPCCVNEYVECFSILLHGERSEIRYSGIIASMSLCQNGQWLLHIENGDDTEDGDAVSEAWCPENAAHVKPDTYDTIASDIDNGRCTGTQALERFKALGGAE